MQLLFNKVDFGASDFEASVLLQIEVKRKMLGWSVTFWPKCVEKRFQQQNFFELATPNAQGEEEGSMKTNIQEPYYVIWNAILNWSYLCKFTMA